MSSFATIHCSGPSRAHMLPVACRVSNASPHRESTNSTQSRRSQNHVRSTGATRRAAVKAGRGESDKQQSPDFVERVFGRLFGQTALDNRSPGGMKRISEEALLEQYPATVTEFAEAMDSDDSEMQTFRPLLAQTRLERLPLRLAYCAKKHGWSSAAFHKQVNTYGGALVLAHSKAGAIFGGYNPRGWIGLGEDRNSLAAFLFSWPDGDTSKPAVKLPKVGGANLAIMDDPIRGIQFGAEGLSIPLSRSDPQFAKCRLGAYYAKNKLLPEGGRSLFAAAESWKGTQLVDLKVYVAEGPAAQWNLDGVVWTTKT